MHTQRCKYTHINLVDLVFVHEYFQLTRTCFACLQDIFCDCLWKDDRHVFSPGHTSNNETYSLCILYLQHIMLFVRRTFSATICGKMIAMLSGLATPVEMKMKLIPSLRHMHHDADTAAKVHNLLFHSFVCLGFSHFRRRLRT